MTCRSCDTANLINERGIAHIGKGEVRAAETAFTQAEFMHDECLGKCDCPHAIGKGE
jgi:hypothetical protein